MESEAQRAIHLAGRVVSVLVTSLASLFHQRGSLGSSEAPYSARRTYRFRGNRISILLSFYGQENAQVQPIDSERSAELTPRSKSPSTSLKTEEHRHGEESETIEHHDCAEDEADRWVRVMREWTKQNLKDSKLVDVVQMLVSVFLAIVGTVALFIYDGQLVEMRHTNNLTSAALSKADQNSVDSSQEFQVQLHHFDASLGQSQVLAAQAITQAMQTKKLAADTHALAQAASIQANQALSQASATQRLAETSKNALVISHRPWIRIDLRQTAPLEFLSNGSAKMVIEIRIQNVGSSVALDVKSSFDIFPIGSTTGTLSEIKVKQQAQCSKYRFAKDEILEGDTMFPHDPMTYSNPVTIRPEQIVPLKADAPTMHGIAGQVGFILAGCVSYRSSFEGSDTASHETLFEYQIARPVDVGGLDFWLEPIGVHPDYSLYRFTNGLTAD